VEKFREYRLSQRRKRVLKKKIKKSIEIIIVFALTVATRWGKGVTISACSLQQTAIVSATEDVVVDALH